MSPSVISNLPALQKKVTCDDYSPPPKRIVVSSNLSVSGGQITFDAEGVEAPGSRFHSRVAHHPSAASGVTIGRGYDMKNRTNVEILNDLREAGMSVEAARLYGTAAGLSGTAADRWLKINKQSAPPISLKQQKRLFSDIVYPQYQRDSERLVNKWSKEQSFWCELSSEAKEIVVDLRYRGDLTPSVFSKIRRALQTPTLEPLLRALENEQIFSSVPAGRARARVQFILQALCS